MGGTEERAMFSFFSFPPFQKTRSLWACCTKSLWHNFPQLLVAVGVCVVGYVDLEHRLDAIIFLATAASTKDLCIFIFL